MNRELRLERYKESDRRDWECFVRETARNSHFMQTRDYLDYHRDRFDDHSLVFLPNDAGCRHF